MAFQNESSILERNQGDLEKARFYSSLFLSLGFCALLWCVFFAEWALQSDFSRFGVLPRVPSGLFGILTAPLIHSGADHLMSNSFTLLILLFALFYFYRDASFSVFSLIYILSGLSVWIMGRPSFHIGASGLVYGLAAFIFFSGLFRRDKKSMALSLIVVFLYGGMVWGVLPVKPEISFESHLFGALAGVALAFAFRKYDPPEKYEWEDEEYSDDGLDYGDTPEQIEGGRNLFENDDDDYYDDRDDVRR